MRRKLLASLGPLGGRAKRKHPLPQSWQLVSAKAAAFLEQKMLQGKDPVLLVSFQRVPVSQENCIGGAGTGD